MSSESARLRTTSLPVDIAQALLEVCRVRVAELALCQSGCESQPAEANVAWRVAEIVEKNILSGRLWRVLVTRGSGVLQRAGSQARGLEPALSPAVAYLLSLAQSEARPVSPPATWDLTQEPELVAYLDRVIITYHREQARVTRLAERDMAAWTELYTQLTHRAQDILVRRGVSLARAQEDAADFAQTACEDIYAARFTYDVVFDAWATLILKNRILQRDRSVELLDSPRTRSLDSLNDESDFSLYDLLVDPSGEIFEHDAVQEWLMQALARLRSRPQRAVIILTFFYGLTDDEIATRLGKPRSTIHVLRHRALLRLKQLLQK